MSHKLLGGIIGCTVSFTLWLTRGYIKKHVGIEHVLYFFIGIPLSTIIGAIIATKYQHWLTHD